MKKYKYLLLTMIWMLYIFYMSHQVGTVSSSSSSSIVDMIISFFNIPVSFSKTLETIIRKSAHILEYMILTYLIFHTIKPYTKHSYNISFFLSVGYACTDELHQYFIPGRSGLVTDVIIDSIGIILILQFIYVYYKFRK